MTTQQYITFGRRTALISFLLGTIILGIYLLTFSFELLFIGYGFIIIIGLINLKVFIDLLIAINNDKKAKKKLLKTCGQMLLNIPIMLLYCWITTIVMNTAQVTFTNTTKTNLTDIEITGCETKLIKNLDKEKSKTVWIKIKRDCHININYLIDSQKKEEIVIGYLCENMGQRLNYKIGNQNLN